MIFQLSRFSFKLFEKLSIGIENEADKSSAFKGYTYSWSIIHTHDLKKYILS